MHVITMLQEYAHSMVLVLTNEGDHHRTRWGARYFSMGEMTALIPWLELRMYANDILYLVTYLTCAM